MKYNLLKYLIGIGIYAYSNPWMIKWKSSWRFKVVGHPDPVMLFPPTNYPWFG